MTTDNARVAFGATVLGPIFADFALRLWTIQSALQDPEQAALLFCARGGLRLRMIYDRVLDRAGLAPPLVERDLMVSRIVAVRAALVRRCGSAYEQIGYELGSGTLLDVAVAVGGPGYHPPLHSPFPWHEPYTRAAFDRLLDCPDAPELRACVEAQTALFRRHLDQCLGGRSHAILCDTGLSGSTMQLLEDAIPELKWSCLLFARANYKRLATPHFPRTVGLSVQADHYSPFDARSSLLRHWHLVEATLEPPLKSVSGFVEMDGVPRSNLERPGWQDAIAPLPDEMFAGILAYIEALPRDGLVAHVAGNVDAAAHVLRRALVWPQPQDAATLDIESRSLDFGRADTMSGRACEPGLRRALRGSLWREGAVTLASPGLRLPILAAVEAIHSARWVSRRLRKW